MGLEKILGDNTSLAGQDWKDDRDYPALGRELPGRIYGVSRG